MKPNNILVEVLLLLSLNACIKEDRSGCIDGARYICFESVMSKYDFRDVVDDMTLYLYDSRNELVFSHLYGVEDLMSQNYIAGIPPHPAGEYTLLASMNSGDDYLTTGQQTLAGFNMSLLPDDVNVVSRKQTDIYHGFRTIEFTDADKNQVVYDLVRLYKNTNHVNITLAYKGEHGTLHADIKADNGSYDERNENIKDDYRIYVPYEQRQEPECEYYSFKVMHVRTDSEMIFRLEERGQDGTLKITMEKDLVREILKVYPTDDHLDQVDVFDIEIELDDTMAVVTLILNGWYVIRDGVEL